MFCLKEQRASLGLSSLGDGSFQPTLWGPLSHSVLSRLVRSGPCFWKWSKLEQTFCARKGTADASCLFVVCPADLSGAADVWKIHTSWDILHVKTISGSMRSSFAGTETEDLAHVLCLFQKCSMWPFRVETPRAFFLQIQPCLGFFGLSPSTAPGFLLS